MDQNGDPIEDATLHLPQSLRKEFTWSVSEEEILLFCCQVTMYILLKFVQRVMSMHKRRLMYARFRRSTYCLTTKRHRAVEESK